MSAPLRALIGPTGAPAGVPGAAVRWAATAAAVMAASVGGWHIVAGAAAVGSGVRGAELLEAGRIPEAFPLLVEAVRESPLQSKPCVDLGDLAVQAIDDEAIRAASGARDRRGVARLAFLAYAEALDRQPGNPAAWAGMAELFRTLRRIRFEEEPLDLDRLEEAGDDLPAPEDRLAVAAYRRAIRFEPGNFFHHAYLGNLFEERGLRGEAIQEWARSIEIMPDLSWHYYLPGRGLPGDLYAEARAALARALESNPAISRERIHQNLGHLADRAGDAATALESFARAAEAAEDPALSLYLKGDLLFRLGRCAEAEETLNAAVAPGTLQPQILALSHTLVARCRRQAGDDGAAIGHLERARRLNAAAWYIAADLAEAYEKAGQIDRAESEYRSAIRLAPDRASVYGGLIRLYRSSGRIGKAIPLAERLVELFPEDRVFRDQLEALQRELGLPDAGGS